MHRPHDSGPIQWARGDVGLKPPAAARPCTLANCQWRAAALGLKALHLPHARVGICKQTILQAVLCKIVTEIPFWQCAFGRKPSTVEGIQELVTNSL